MIRASLRKAGLLAALAAAALCSHAQNVTVGLSADVTSTDYVQALLDKGAARARADDLDATYRAADAEALPFGDGCFDAALSTFGVMFAPDRSWCPASTSKR